MKNAGIDRLINKRPGDMLPETGRRNGERRECRAAGIRLPDEDSVYFFLSAGGVLYQPGPARLFARTPDGSGAPGALEYPPTAADAGCALWDIRKGNGFGGADYPGV